MSAGEVRNLFLASFPPNNGFIQSSAPYHLYGIICHAGGTPNSGHYYAFVQNPSSGWSRMNDEDALHVQSPPNDIKTAYMLFYMREPASMDSAIAKATISRKAPATPLSGQKRKRDDRAAESSSEADLGERLTAYSSQTLGENVNPLPAKKPRYEGNATRAIPNVTSALNKSKFSFVNPHLSISIAQPTAPPRPPKKIVTTFQNKDLGLAYGSSEPEDQDDTPIQSQHMQSSQTDGTTASPPPSSLPASRENSPETSILRPKKAWQHTHSTPSSSRTPHDSPPSSPESRKRRAGDSDETDEFNGSTLKRQKSDDNIPTWLSGNAAPRKLKTYQSRTKKEKRGNRTQNPYGSLGLPTGGARPPMNGAKFGVKKNRKPGTL